MNTTGAAHVLVSRRHRLPGGLDSLVEARQAPSGETTKGTDASPTMTRPVPLRGQGREGRKMEFYSPDTWREALEVKAAHPEAVPIFGGTDVMVDLNFDRQRPGAVLDLTRVPELRGVGG